MQDTEGKYQQRARSHFSFSFRLFGIFTSAASLISLIQRIFHIGLNPIFKEFIEFYRKITYPIIEFVPAILHIQIPHWYKDLYILSFIFLMALSRSEFSRDFIAEVEIFRRNLPPRAMKQWGEADVTSTVRSAQIRHALWHAFSSAALSILLIGIVIFIMIMWMGIMACDIPWDTRKTAVIRRQIFARFCRSLGIMLTAAIAYFILNAYV